MKRFRVASLGLVVVAALMWALPASANRGSANMAMTVKVTAGKPTEFAFTLKPKAVMHGKVTFVVTNSGAIVHDFQILGKKTPNINPGKTAKLTVTFKKAGKYPYICTVSGHAAAGMKGVLKVS
jgi:uncharacterized cupredoxin-like copper-binding protein